MTISEAEDTLPNGLHDAELLNVRVDYQNRTAALEFLADYSSSESEEADRKVTLLVTGLHFIAVPPPDLQNGYAADETAWVMGFDRFDEKHPVSEDVKGAVRHLPAKAFCECTFVNDWNRCLVIAAEDTRIETRE